MAVIVVTRFEGNQDFVPLLKEAAKNFELQDRSVIATEDF